LEGDEFLKIFEMKDKNARVWIALFILTFAFLSGGCGRGSSQDSESFASAGAGMIADGGQSTIPDNWVSEIATKYDYKRLNTGESDRLWAALFTNGQDVGGVGPLRFDVESGGEEIISLGAPPDGRAVDVSAEKPGIAVVRVSNPSVISGFPDGVVAGFANAYVVFEVVDPAKEAGLSVETSLTEYADVVDYYGGGANGTADVSTYNTFYFTGENTSHTFTVTAEGAESISVSVNGGPSETKTGASGEFTVTLENRQNIIAIKAAQGGKETNLYKVLKARKIEINVVNATNPGQPFKTGDTAHISFRGIVLPVGQIPQIYNPYMGGSYVRYYNENFGEMRGVCAQYNLAVYNTISVVLNEAGTQTFTGGDIYTLWWGRPLGTDKIVRSASGMVGGAVVFGKALSPMPDFTIEVAQGALNPPTGLTLSKNSMSLIEYLTEADNYIDYNRKLANSIVANVVPPNADELLVEWDSSDPEVAAVAPPSSAIPVNGAMVVTGHSGTAILTARVKNTNITATATVNVIDPSFSVVVDAPKHLYPGGAVRILTSGAKMRRVNHKIDELAKQYQDLKATAHFRYSTSFPGLPTVDSEPITLYDSNPSSSLNFSNTLTFNVPGDTPVNADYRLYNTGVVIKYTHRSGSGEESVYYESLGKMEDIAFHIYDPKKATVAPDVIYPGAVVSVTLGLGATSKTHYLVFEANNLQYTTTIPGLSIVTVYTAQYGNQNRTITFTIPEDTPLGTYYLKNPAFIHHNPVTGKESYEPIDWDPEGAPTLIKIKVAEKPDDLEPQSFAYFDVERSTIGQGLFFEPKKFPIEDGITTVYELIATALGEESLIARNDNNYLAAIKGADAGTVNIPDYIALLDGDASNGPTTEDAIAYGKSEKWDADTLGEFDYSGYSGWMYLINDEMSGLGISEQTLRAGDTVRLAFSFYGYGMDLGDSFGSIQLPYSFPNHDKLVKLMAEANELPEGERTAEIEAAYASALAAHNYLIASQEDINEAAGELQDLLGISDEDLDPPNPSDNDEDQDPPVPPATDDPDDTEALDALDEAIEFILGDTPNPTYDGGSVNTEWAVMAVARYGLNNDAWYSRYRGNLLKYLEDYDIAKGKVVLNKSKYTENERVILALSALGEDASDFRGYDFVSSLTDKQDNGQYQTVKQGINGAIFALIALDSNGYLENEKDVRGYYLTYLLTNVHNDGGWSLLDTPSFSSDADLTGMALQALARYYRMASQEYAELGLTGAPDYSQIKSAVDKALTLLSGMQNSVGSFGGMDGQSVESTAQVLTALCALDIDPASDSRFIKGDSSVISALLSFRDSATGGFKHALSGKVDSMGTEQAAYALVAYKRFVENLNPLYDMSDAVKSGNDETGDEEEEEQAEEEEAKEDENADETTDAPGNLDEITVPATAIPAAVSDKAAEEFEASALVFERKGITLAGPDDVRTIEVGDSLPDALLELGTDAESFMEAKDGAIYVKRDPLEKEIADSGYFKDAVDTDEAIVTQSPVVLTVETEGETVIIPLRADFAGLGGRGRTIGDLLLMKVRSDGSLLAPGFKDSLSGISREGDYVIKDAKGETMSAGDSLTNTGAYYIYIAIKDDGDYDWDKTPNAIFDPLCAGVRQEKSSGNDTGTETETDGDTVPGGTGGGGCDSGAAALALVFLALTLARKRKL
jgi:hypothetical protein